MISDCWKQAPKFIHEAELSRPSFLPRPFLSRVCFETSAVSSGEGANIPTSPSKQNPLSRGLAQHGAPSLFLPQDPHSLQQFLTVIEEEGKGWSDPADPTCSSCLCVQVLESRLQRPLPEDLAEALANGVILCQLANQLRPRSVPFIHVPSPAVVSGSPEEEEGQGRDRGCTFPNSSPSSSVFSQSSVPSSLGRM